MISATITPSILFSLRATIPSDGNGGAPFSPEATNYFSRLDAAGDTTYVDYKQPLANYIDSLVTLGGAYWDTMLSATSFVGVGIQGVTVPLRSGMTAPTNNNFVAGDLDQLTGLKGDASTKYLDTGYIDSDLAQNNGSLSVYVDTPSSKNGTFYAGTTSTGNTGTFLRKRVINPQLNVHGFLVDVGTAIIGGLVAVSRTGSTSVNARTNQTNYSFTDTSTTPTSDALQIFARQSSGISDARLATYHAGPALDLATLEGLQATLLSEIRTAHTFVAAASYFSRLAAAGDTAHVAYKQPLTNYITSLVELGGAYWENMESAASFVGVGIQGITVPLRDGMTVPTQNNFVSGDLDQLTGLASVSGGEAFVTGTTEANYAQDDVSLTIYVTTPSGTGRIAGTSVTSNSLQLRDLGSALRASAHDAETNYSGAIIAGLVGLSRSSSAGANFRHRQTDSSNALPSSTPVAGALSLFGYNNVPNATGLRLATYTAGPALNLATLEGLQATLLAEIAGIGFSTEAANYFGRLANAGDTTFLAYRQPLANYIDSLVALGGAYWDDMKSAASFVGVGIQGVTVPLRDGMTVPTQNNFVDADLNQLTGLKGDVSTKYIATNVAGTALSQNDVSASVYQTALKTSGGGFVLANNGPSIGLRSQGTQWINGSISLGGTSTIGLYGAARSTSTDIDVRNNQTDYSGPKTSLTPSTSTISLFAIGVAPSSNSRLATYHVGPALNLATLEGLQETLITEVAAAKGAAAAANYFARLDTAGDTTYVPYKQPLTNYISSLVALGGAYWDTMESAASFVGVGIQGVTVPLKDGMPSITNNNFVAGDLDQLTGLKGNASTKYIDSGLNATSLSQNDASVSVYVSTPPTSNTYMAGAYSGVDTIVLRKANTLSNASMFTSGFTSFGTTLGAGLLGVSRSDSANQNRRSNQIDYPEARASVTPISATFTVFAISGLSRTDSRLATYHAGPALNLATFEGLQATLITEIAAI